MSAHRLLVKRRDEVWLRNLELYGKDKISLERLAQNLGVNFYDLYTSIMPIRELGQQNSFDVIEEVVPEVLNKEVA